MGLVGVRTLRIVLLYGLFLVSPHLFAQQIIPLMMGEEAGWVGSPPVLRPRVEKTLHYLETELSVRFSIQRYPYNRVLMNLKNGDGLAFGLSKTTGRSAFLRFSAPVYSTYVWLVTRSDARFEFGGLSDLKGKTVGVVSGVSYGDEFDQVKTSLFHVENDPPNLLVRCKKLYSRRMDVMLVNSDSAKAEQVEQRLSRVLKGYFSEVNYVPDVPLSVASKPVWVDDIYFASGLNDNPAFIERLNAAIEKGKKAGAFDPV